jgi:hypothetical protein
MGKTPFLKVVSNEWINKICFIHIKIFI